MPFLLLLVLALPCLLQIWPAPPFAATPELWTVLSWTPLALVLTVTWLVTRAIRRGLLRPNADREKLLRRYGSFRGYQIFALMFAYVGMVYGCGWGWVVGQCL